MAQAPGVGVGVGAEVEEQPGLQWSHCMVSEVTERLGAKAFEGAEAFQIAAEVKPLESGRVPSEP